MVIAVDFDGTIVEHRFPKIGKEVPFAIVTLKKLQAEGHILILWSVREGELLDEAIAFCQGRGLVFHAANSNVPEGTENAATHACRKVKADLYIDDRNVGGLPDWGIIYEMIQNRCSYEEYFRSLQSHDTEKTSFWQRLLGR